MVTPDEILGLQNWQERGCMSKSTDFAGVHIGAEISSLATLDTSGSRARQEIFRQTIELPCLQVKHFLCRIGGSQTVLG